MRGRFRLSGAMAFLPTLAAAVAMTLSSHVYAAGVSIELPPLASVAGTTVRLGDIAKVRGADADETARIEAIDLGPAPPAGAPVRLTRAALARWVSARLGQSAQVVPVQWRGADIVQVEMRTQGLPWKRIDEVAGDYLMRWLSGRAEPVKLSSADRGVDMVLPSGDVSLIPRTIGDDAFPQALMTLWIDVRVDGVLVKTVPVRFRVEGAQHVWVSRMDQSPGVALVAEAFELRDVPLSALRQRALPPPDLRRLTDGTAPARLRRSLRSGQALTSDDVESSPDVARGETATLTVNWGAVVVESPVEVMQDGRQGEMVRVRPKTSSEAVLARVSGPGKLEISR